MLHEQSDNFPLFPNMCALSLESCLLDDERHLDSRLEDLGSFLENAPCLEKLTFRHTLVHISVFFYLAMSISGQLPILHASCITTNRFPLVLRWSGISKGKASACKVRMERHSDAQS
jgi:hypothetical protein